MLKEKIGEQLPQQFNFHDDPGHGWLQVPFYALEMLVDSVYDYAMTNPTQLQETKEGTVFGAYNAVTGHFQNIRGYKDQEAKVKSLYFGGTAQQRTQAAFNLCSAFSKDGTEALQLN